MEIKADKGKIGDLVLQTKDEDCLLTLNEFIDLDSQTQNIEKLKRFGLSPNEIQLYLEYLRGNEHLRQAHRNMDRGALMDSIKYILDKIKPADASGIKPTEKQKEYFISTTFLSGNIKTQVPIPADHPINHLEELKDDLFGHMDVDNTLTTNRKRKFLRRMERKIKKDIELPEPSTLKPCSKQQDKMSSHYFNEFIKASNTQGKSNQPLFSGNNSNINSKWDIKDMSCYETDSFKVKQHIENPRDKLIIGCKPQTLYTIKNNKILRLETFLKDDRESHESDKYKAVDIIVPINKAEEKLMEGTRLSLDEIKAIHRFENYETGLSSNVLYLKNLSKHLNEDELYKMFLKFDPEVKISLLSGRMRGQAFATFTRADNATMALNETNGTILKGKPIIIQYGNNKEL